MFDLDNLMDKAKDFQSKFQDDIDKMSIKASAGGVTVTVNGKKEITDISLDENATNDREMLEDWILSATHKAYGEVDREMKDKLGGLANLGGIDLSTIQNMFK